MSQTVLTVLIADDEATIRNGLLNAIDWSFFHAEVIATAADGGAALSCIRQHHPDLVIIDIKMPILDGLEVIRLAKKEGIESRFLILSGYNDFSLAQKAIRYGASGYFLKPLKIEEFKNELTQQFSELLSLRHSTAARANLESLVHTSKIFFLNQLIRNEIRSSEELERRFSLSNPNIRNESCMVLVCTAAISNSETLSSLMEQAIPILTDELNGLSFEIWMHMDEQLAVIINPQDKEDIYYRSIIQRAASAIHSLKERTGARFFIGIGETVSSLSQAALSYSSALRALSYHIYEKEDDVYDSSIICKKQPPFSPDSIDCEPLLLAIEGSDENAIRQFCFQFLQSLLFVPMPPPDFIRGMCIYLANHSRIAFFSRHPDLAPASPASGEDTRFLHTLSELCDWLVYSILDYSRPYAKSRENSDPVIEAAKAFIQKNLSSNVKARDIASAVGLSESYFTIYFKNKTGQNFRDYVLGVRMEYAKLLLSQHKMSVSEIAYTTGYQDYRSFSRAFKNVTGMSPSDFENH